MDSYGYVEKLLRYIKTDNVLEFKKYIISRGTTESLIEEVVMFKSYNVLEYMTNRYNSNIEHVLFHSLSLQDFDIFSKYYIKYIEVYGTNYKVGINRIYVIKDNKKFLSYLMHFDQLPEFLETVNNMLYN